MNISRPVRWMIGSVVSACLSLGALYALHPSDGGAVGVAALILVTTTWLGFVVWWISLLCWIAMNLFPVDGK